VSSVVLALALLFAAGARADRDLYVSNFGSDELSGFAIAASGSLTALPGFPVATGNGPGGVAMTPDGRRIYVANRLSSSISGFSVGAGGSLVPLPGSPFLAAAPDDLAVSADGTRLYAVGALTANIYGFQIAPDGSLSPLPGSPFTAGSPSAAVALTADGRHLYVTNQADDALAVFDAAADGSLVAAGPPLAVGEGPTGISITPDGKHLYVASFESDEIAGFDVAADGSLSPLPGSPSAANGAQGVAITPDGRRLYSTSLFFGTFAFGIGAGGALAPVSNSPFAGGEQTLGVAAAPSGAQLYVAGSSSNDILPMSIAPSGALAPIGPPVPTEGIGPGLRSIAVTPGLGPVARLGAVSIHGMSASFDASASSDPDGTVTRFTWDFGDGTTVLTATPTASHTYAAPGAYTVRVTVADEGGCSSSTVYTGQSALCAGNPAATASAPLTIQRGDDRVSIRIRGRKLRLDRRGRASVRLSCPASEASGPCQGKAVLQTRGRVRFGAKRRKVTLASSKFRIASGRTRAVTLKLGKRQARLVRVNRRARRVAAIVTVRDQAGNRARIAKKLTLVPSDPKASKRNRGGV
jgi:DNA-binding beta-propeller fold protein YncE